MVILICLLFSVHFDVMVAAETSRAGQEELYRRLYSEISEELLAQDKAGKLTGQESGYKMRELPLKMKWKIKQNFQVLQELYAQRKAGKLTREELFDKWNQLSPLEMKLTAQQNDIYQKLIAQFKTKQLTIADNTEENLYILEFQKDILNIEKAEINYYMYVTPEAGFGTMRNIVSPIVLNAMGYLGHKFVNYFNDKNIIPVPTSTWQAIDNLISVVNLLGNAVLVPLAAWSAAHIGLTHFRNSPSRKRIELIDKEITLIDDIVLSLKATSV